MESTKTLGLVLLLGCSIFSCGCDTVAQAQGREKAQHYALENYATYATTSLTTEEERGYSDGFRRGQKQARKYVGPNPIEDKYYRNGSSKYREGYLRGFTAGFHQRDHRKQ